MSDRLEDFIRNNRSEFDIESPSSFVWEAIEKEIQKKPKFNIIKILSVAASVMILVAAGYFMGSQNNSNEIDANLFASETQFDEFKEAEEFYVRTINYQMGEINTLDVDDDVISDIEQLDAIYEELKEEMLNNQYKDKEVLINLLINNYKTKIEILERIINKTKIQSDDKKFDNETITI